MRVHPHKPQFRAANTSPRADTRKLSFEEMRAIVRADFETGRLFALTRGRGRLPGDVLPCRQNSRGYATIQVAGAARMLVHRVVFALSIGCWPEGIIDHINRNKLDNRLSNLRLASESENNVNKPGLERTSRFKGVSWHRQSKRWRAQTKFAGRKIHIGSYATEHEAALAYDSRVRVLFGDFAFLNFPERGRV